MPATYDIDSARRRVIVPLTGNLTTREAVDLLTALIADPQLRGRFDGIIDSTRLTGIELMGIDVRRMAAVAAAADEHWQGARWAIVAATPTVYGLARMYVTLRSGAPYEIDVFRCLDDAEAWLDQAR